MKVLTILGARPQFVKAAMVSQIFREQDKAEEILLHTGQHFDKNMSDIFFGELKIQKPHFNLEISGGDHGEQTGKMLIAIEKKCKEIQPDCILVYGDTNSTLAGALVASKLHIPVAHVEAGLRSFNKKMPEEINRILTDHISEWLFCPTDTSVTNLKKEGFKDNKIFQVGDVMFDACLHFSKLAEDKSAILNQLNLTPKQFILCTIHRAENTNSQQKLTEIFETLIQISKEQTVVLPLHPRTKNFLKQYGLLDKVQKNLCVIEPIGYLDMLTLEKNAKCIATDSGGIQKEAFFLNVPCITLRDETEWVELVKIGANQIVGSDSQKIKHSLCQNYDSVSFKENLYGTGKAAKNIVRILKLI